MWWSLLLVMAAALAVPALEQADRAWTPDPAMTRLRSLLYHESLLMLPLLALALTGLRRRYFSRGFGLVLAMLMVAGLYARYVEPNLLLVRHTVIETGYPLKVALVSDMHYGLFSTPAQMRQLVTRLNALDVRAVLVAGDWTYEPARATDLGELLAPFRALRHPVYSVPGNHDEEQPGPPLQAALSQALRQNGIMTLEGREVELGPVRLVGLGDLWAGHTGAERLPGVAAGGRPMLLLAHNPDLVDALPALPAPVLMLAGHTHGGQVNLPLLTERMLAGVTRSGYKRGLYARPNGQVFVTSGIGMIGLPIRFAMPPVIDVLEMR